MGYLCDCFCNHLINHTLQYTCNVLHVVTETPKLLRCPGKTSRSKNSECYTTILVCTGLLSILFYDQLIQLIGPVYTRRFSKENMTLLSCFGCPFTQKGHLSSLKMALSKNRSKSGAFSGRFCMNAFVFKKEKMMAIPAARSNVNRI